MVTEQCGLLVPEALLEGQLKKLGRARFISRPEVLAVVVVWACVWEGAKLYAGYGDPLQRPVRHTMHRHTHSSKVIEKFL